MRFTPFQIYMMKRLMNGVHEREWLKWDQRAFRGLFMRYLFKFDAHGVAYLTRKGQDEYIDWYTGCDTAKIRKNSKAPAFKGAYRRRAA